MATAQEIPKELQSDTIWRAKAVKYQNSINDIFGNRHFDSFPIDYLRGKVEFALFGPPPYDELSSESVKLVDNLVSHITLLHKKHFSDAKNICLGYTFVYLRYKNSNLTDIQVLFKVPAADYYSTNECHFVDLNCLTYEGWANYLGYNSLPICDMCFPKNGRYSFEGGFAIEFAESPACTSSIIMRGLRDLTSLLIDITASGITLAALAVTSAANSTGSFGMAGAGASHSGSPFAVLNIFPTYSNSIVPSIGMTSLHSCSSINKIRQGNLGITDTEKFIKTFLFFFNESLSVEASETIIRKIASLISSRNGFYFSTRYITFTRINAVSEYRRNANFERLLEMVSCRMEWMVSNVRLSDLDSIVNKLVHTIFRISKQIVSVEDSLLDLTIAYKDIWNMVELSIEEARYKVLSFEVFHSTPTKVKAILKSNPEIVRELFLLLRDIIEYCEVEDPTDYFKEKIYVFILTSYNDLNNYIDLTAVKFSRVINFLSSKLIQSYDSEILAYKFDYDKYNKGQMDKRLGMMDPDPSGGNTKSYSKENEIKLRIYFGHIIKHHQLIKRNVKTLNGALSTLLFVFNQACSIQCCVALYGCIEGQEFSQKLKYGLLMIIVFWCLTLFCWFGQQLMNEGEELYLTFAQCSWIGKPLWFKKSLNMILTCSRQPLRVMPLGLYVLNFDNMKTVLQAAYSYFNLMHSTNKKNN
ncbi:uncharacterized protein LOC111055883 [Nilaparvata lugens]|uniref:uncharacterized protein LOC111055883 n=1 Tax=Nilaparvata lugens TaxID=108931 RepID=UPI00193D6734|nr:uncharacterized protein LOC111055883 [Nilaparvata lugens]